MTEGHVEALGGEERVRETVPHVRCEEWDMQGKKGLYIQVTKTPLELTSEKRLALKRALAPVIYKEYPHEVGFLKEYESCGIALEAEDHAKWQVYRKMVDEGGLNAIGGEMGKFKYQGKSERMLPLEELEERRRKERK